MHRTDNYSHHSSIVKKDIERPVWLSGSIFVYELSGCRFESSCGYVKFSRLKGKF